MPISGLPHLAHFLLRSAKFHQTHLVGRLKLLEKLVEMHREAPPDTADVNKRISYRHLCSSLIFARRHVYPPDQPVFPHNYVSEEEMSARFGGVGVVGGVGACGAILGHGVITVRRPPSTNGHAPINAVSRATAAESSEVYVSTTACLMEANIKASRLVSSETNFALNLKCKTEIYFDENIVRAQSLMYFLDVFEKHPKTFGDTIW